MKPFNLWLIAFLTISSTSVNSQITTQCSTLMISTFTPCLNYITGSSSNGASLPTTSCCNTLKTVVGMSMDCACLLITASVPFQLPINQVLALFLPTACNMEGFPIACKASVSPLPAPGPSSYAPSPSPSPASSSLSPQASKAVAQTQAPKSEAPLQLAPTFPPVESQRPPAHKIQPVLTPSSSSSSTKFSVSPSYLAIFAAIMGFYTH